MSDKVVETFSARELEIMSRAWLCMDTEPKVNYEQLAEACGFTNVGSANNAWARIKKKIISNGSVGANSSPKAKSGDENEAAATPKPKAAAKKRGRKPKDATDENGESPAKKPRKAVKKEVVEENNEDNADEKDAEEEVED